MEAVFPPLDGELLEDKDWVFTPGTGTMNA